jgi:hypothetical protein
MDTFVDPILGTSRRLRYSMTSKTQSRNSAYVAGGNNDGVDDEEDMSGDISEQRRARAT